MVLLVLISIQVRLPKLVVMIFAMVLQMVFILSKVAPVLPIQVYPQNLLEDLQMMDLHQLFQMPSELKLSPPMLVYITGPILMAIVVLILKLLADPPPNQVAPLRPRVTAKDSDCVA